MGHAIRHVVLCAAGVLIPVALHASDAATAEPSSGIIPVSYSCSFDDTTMKGFPQPHSARVFADGQPERIGVWTVASSDALESGGARLTFAIEREAEPLSGQFGLPGPEASLWQAMSPQAAGGAGHFLTRPEFLLIPWILLFSAFAARFGWDAAQALSNARPADARRRGAVGTLPPDAVSVLEGMKTSIARAKTALDQNSRGSLSRAVFEREVDDLQARLWAIEAAAASEHAGLLDVERHVAKLRDDLADLETLANSSTARTA